MNAIEREPVPTRVFNPNASEASYKPKQRSYRMLFTEMVLYSKVAKRAEALEQTQGKQTPLLTSMVCLHFVSY